MTQEEINEGNPIIAKWMDLKESNGRWYRWGEHQGQGYFTELKYHTSWDWLMPVVAKIKDYLHNMPNRPSKNHCCNGDMIEVDIQCHLWELSIEKTFRSVIEFIKWHNSIKP